MTGSRPLKLVDFDEVQRTDAAIEELASRRGESGHSSDPALLILDELIADVDEREPILRAVGSAGSARRTGRGRRGRFIAALGIGVVIAGGSTGVAVAGSEIFDDLHTPPRVESVHKGGDGRSGGAGEEIEAGVAPPSGGANAVRPPRASRERPGVPGEQARRAERGKLDHAGVPGEGLDPKVDESTGKTGPEVDTGVDVDTPDTDVNTTDSGKDSSTDAETDSTNAKSKSKSKGKKGRGKTAKQASTPDEPTTTPAGEATDNGRAADGTTGSEDSGEVEAAVAPPATTDEGTSPAATDSDGATEETDPITAQDSASGDESSTPAGR